MRDLTTLTLMRHARGVAKAAPFAWGMRIVSPLMALAILGLLRFGGTSISTSRNVH
jgi:hypothetical protein